MSTNWRVLLLDTKARNPNHYLVIALEHALRANSGVDLVRSACYEDALHVAIRERCNLFLAFDGEAMDVGLCKRLALTCGTSVLWLTEDPYERATNVRNAAHFDLVFTNDASSVSAYGAGARHLPLAACPRFHRLEVPPEDDAHYRYDLLFVGTAWPNRVRALREITKRLDGLEAKLALPYNEHLPAPDLGLPASAYLWRVSNRELARLSNRSRVTLTLHRDFSASGGASTASTPGPRLFEAALAGGFQLVDLALPEVERYFTPGLEIGAFLGVDECVDRLRSFLADPRARLEMARAAQQRCEDEHLYANRVDRILALADTARERAQAAPIRVEASPTRPTRVLHVAHNWVDQPPFGGVEVYLQTLVDSFPDDVEPWVYYPDRRYRVGRAMVLWNTRTGERRHHVFDHDLDPYALSDLEREAWFATTLHRERIDLVHVHHLIGHPWSLPLVARTMGIPVVMTVADYYPVCAHFNLVDYSRRYCNIAELPRVTCDLCLQEQDGIGAGSQASRRSFVDTVLRGVDRLVFLSQAAREITETQFPALRGDERVSVEGYPSAAVSVPRPARPGSGTTLRVAFVGNCIHTKGAQTLVRVVDAMRDDAVEFHLLGAVLAPYDDALRRLGARNLTIHGAYAHDALPETLASMDVSVLLSIWPETYVLTLSESWRAGVVPIVTDIGALGERVEHRVNGLKVGVDRPATVVQLLRELCADRAELARLGRGIHPGLYLGVDEHLRWLTTVYRDLVEGYAVRSREDAFWSIEPDRRPAGTGETFRNAASWRAGVASGGPVPATVARRLRRDAGKVIAHLRTHGVRSTLRRIAERARRSSALR